MIGDLPGKNGPLSGQVTVQKQPDAGARVATFKPRSSNAWRRLLGNKLAVICLVYLGVLILGAILAPWIAPYDYKFQDLNHVHEYPSGIHLLGTDMLGRDILSRLLYGARMSLLIGFVVVVTELVVGVFMGVIAGYFGGWIDSAILRLVDLTYAFPGLLLAVFMIGVLGREVIWLVVAFVVLGWPAMARLVRAQVLTAREQDYILACRAMGVPDWRIMLRHILPNSLSATIVRASMAVGGVMLAEAGLSFLGMVSSRPILAGAT